VDDSDIAITVLRLLEMEKLVVEGAGATGLAAILAGLTPELKGMKVVAPLCGCNIDTNMLSKVIDRGLAADKRLVRFSVLGNDRPGGLNSITGAISKSGASIRDVSHERAWVQEDTSLVENRFVVETTGDEHAEELKQALLAGGWQFKWGNEKWAGR